MAHITIKDLPLDVELDRQAMAAIVGGSRAGRENGLQQRTAQHSTVVGSSSRIVDYPPGFARRRTGGDSEELIPQRAAIT